MELFDRPGRGEQAVLVHVCLGGKKEDADVAREFSDLALAAGAQIVGEILAKRAAPDPKFFVGSGKVEQIKAIVVEQCANVVLVDHGLSPAQERNLERALQCRVLDRTGLILDIFAQRARSYEGKLQVELAQLRHLTSRLVRGWTHLERQRGGIGLRGPGETQLEMDRRLIGIRIKQLKKRLEKVDKQRQGQRRARQKSRLATASLVGYTNAGKSTLFNAVARADVFVANQLFATLDPTLRRVNLPESDPVILADTVGFVRELPHSLVAAFHATLQESREADLLLHVIDASDPLRDQKVVQVDAVLKEIGAESVPQLYVFNKIDIVEGAEPKLDRGADGMPIRVWVSAASGAGLDLLRGALAERLYGEHAKPRHNALSIDGGEDALNDFDDTVLDVT